MHGITNLLKRLVLGVVQAMLGVCRMGSPAEDKDTGPGAILLEGSSASLIADARSIGIKNILAAMGLPFADSSSSGKHKPLWAFGRTNPVGDSDYASLPIGSLFFEVETDSAGDYSDARIWLMGAGGWSSLGGNRVAYRRLWGAADTQIDISNPRKNVFRYTWDSTGTDPNWATNNMQVGDSITINCGNFSAGNNLTARVVRVTDDYFEIENSSGVVEDDNVLGATDAVQSSLTLDAGDRVVIANYAAATTLTLPAGASSKGVMLTVKNIGAGNVTIDGNAAETIDGLATILVAGAGGFVTIVCDGANWRIVDPDGVIIPDGGDATAVPVAISGTYIHGTAAGAETRTLAAPSFAGQVICLAFDADNGDNVITATPGVNQAGNTSLTFADEGDEITLRGCSSGGSLVWRVVSNDGVALA